VVIGCGSTYYLSRSTAQLLTLYTDFEVQALPSSEAWLIPESISSPESTLLLAISRSGTTTETIRAVEGFQQDGGQNTAVITCFPKSPLAKLADVVLSAVEAQEESVVQTRSFTSMYLLSAGLAYILGNRPELLSAMRNLPMELESLTADYSDNIEHWADLERFQKIFFLGNGPNYGLACEAMLKVKEMSLSWVEAFHTLEFRHGPMSLVDDQTLVISFISSALRQAEIEVLNDLQKLGGTIVLCDSDQKKELTWKPAYYLHLNNQINAWLSGILYLTLMQQLGYHRALLNGQNPDQPKNLKQVIEI
jgi:glucosamine--fructose-6-phosphate aminotransferase (isomerizing)